MENIYLIGYMGTGKSTIGRALTRFLMEKAAGCDDLIYCDTDYIIEVEQRKRITEIFKEQGEDYFRDLETALLKKISKRKNLVVSCGGGMPLRDENAKLLRDSGRVVWLDATPETIYKRLAGDETRPLLKNNLTPDYIRDMMTKRRPFYERVAEHHVMVDDLSVEELVLQIFPFFRRG